MSVSLGFWKTRSCGLMGLLLCERNSTPSARGTVQPTVLPKGGCPQNWKRLNTKCYNIINKERKTWEEARTHCRAMGGNLASILSRHEQVYLAAMMMEAPTTDLWIGLSSRNNQPFYWTDGRPRVFNNWDTRHHFHHHMYEEDGECVLLASDTDRLGRWTKKSCNQTNGYVCLRSVDPSFPDSTTAPTTDYVKVANDSFRAVSKKMTWYDARKHCKTEGASLASLRNAWSKAFIDLATLNSSVWIGLNTKESSGFFRYTEGWHLTITNWASREPSSTRPCVYVDMDGQWRTSDCNVELASVCMKTTDVPPTIESSDYPGLCPDPPERPRFGSRRSSNTVSWMPFKANCYLIIPERNSWPEASAKCAAHGGSLVSIEDPSEQTFIYSYIQMFKDSIDTFWIGLYTTHRGQLRWLDKTVVDYTNWAEGQPSSRFSSYGQSYAVIRPWDGKWLSDTGRSAAICETPKVLLQAAPTAENPKVEPQNHSSVLLPVVLVICVTALLIVIIVVLYKKSGRSFPVPRMSNAFHNPLFSAHGGRS